MADRYERDRYDRERGDRERGYGRDDRGMMDRAGDEVRSWFGDEDAAQRRERDERESHRGREYSRAYGSEPSRPYGSGDAVSRGWSGGQEDRWRESGRESGRTPEDWRPRQDWNMAASRPARLESSSQFPGSSYAGSQYGGSYDQGARSFRDDDRSYGGGFSRERQFRSSRFNAGDTSRDYPAWNYQDVSSAASDYGAIGPSAGWTESRGQFTGRGPKGYQRSDDRIREDVCDRLSDDPHIDASDIEITVRNGEVTLAGSVRDRSDKRHAEDVIERISGVREVNNSLRVNRASTNPGDVIGLNSEKGSGPITKR